MRYLGLSECLWVMSIGQIHLLLQFSHVSFIHTISIYLMPVISAIVLGFGFSAK